MQNGCAGDADAPQISNPGPTEIGHFLIGLRLALALVAVGRASYAVGCGDPVDNRISDLGELGGGTPVGETAFTSVAGQNDVRTSGLWPKQ